MRKAKRRDPLEQAPAPDLDLPEFCAGCGGTVSARFGANGGGHGVCLACHVLSTLSASRAPEGGVHVVQVFAGAA